MLQLQPLDPKVPIFEQLGSDVSPVVLVNVFQVAEADIPGLLKAWEDDANRMKRQPGYISTQLHRAIGASNLFLNYAVWEPVAHFQAAFNHPDFKLALEQYPSSVVASPHLFSRVATPKAGFARNPKDARIMRDCCKERIQRGSAASPLA